jgi:hypothetical protein
VRAETGCETEFYDEVNRLQQDRSAYSATAELNCLGRFIWTHGDRLCRMNRPKPSSSKELEEDGESSFRGGFWNNIFDLSLTIMTVLASLVATVLATSDEKGVPR